MSEAAAEASERIWERARAGQSSAVLGPVGAAPPGLRVLRARCDGTPTTFGPLVEMRQRIGELLGEGPLAEVGDRVVVGLLRRFFREAPAGGADAALVEAANRLVDEGGRPLVLVFEAVDAADPVTLDMLRLVVLRPGWLRAPMVLGFREARPTGAAGELLAALRRSGGDEAVIEVRATAGAAAVSWRGLDPGVLAALRAGAVIGAGFEVELVAQLLESSAASVLGRLQAAVDAGIPIEDRGDGRLTLPTGLAAELRATMLPSLAAAWHRRLASLLAGEGEAHAAAPPAGESRAPARSIDLEGEGIDDLQVEPFVEVFAGPAGDAGARPAGAEAGQAAGEAGPGAAEAGSGAAAEGPGAEPAGPAAEAGSGAAALEPRSDAGSAGEAARGAGEAGRGGGVAEGSGGSRAAVGAGAAEGPARDAAGGATGARGEESRAATQGEDHHSRRHRRPGHEEAGGSTAAMMAEGAGGPRGGVRRGDEVAEGSGGPRGGVGRGGEVAEGAGGPRGGVGRGGEVAEGAGGPRGGAGRGGEVAEGAGGWRGGAEARLGGRGAAAEGGAQVGGAGRAMGPAPEGATEEPGHSRRHRRAVHDAARAASHLSAAGDEDAAARRFVEAARQAAEQGASGRASTHARRALGLLDALPRTPARQVLRAQALVEVARTQWRSIGADGPVRLDDALATAMAAKAALPADAPAHLHAEVSLLIAGIGHDRGDLRALEQALAELTDASRRLLEAGDALAAAALLNDQAAIYLRLGDPVRATHLLMRSREVFEGRARDDASARRELAETHHLLARLPLRARLRPGREGDAMTMALDHALIAERTYRELGMRLELARVWETMGRLELRKGRGERAAERLSAALSLQRELGDVDGLARTTASFADLLATRGEIREALGLLGSSITLNREKGSPIGLAFNRRSLEALAPLVGAEGRALVARIERELSAGEELLGRRPLPPGLAGGG